MGRCTCDHVARDLAGRGPHCVGSRFAADLETARRKAFQSPEGPVDYYGENPAEALTPQRLAAMLTRFRQRRAQGR